MAESITSEARKIAEEKVRVILDECDERTLALLHHTMLAAGWSRDRAQHVLRKERWWLG